MLIYEKNNKLNINFENSLENPDIEFGKSEIKVDGNNIVNGSSSGGGSMAVIMTQDEPGGLEWVGDKTYKEVYDAMYSGISVLVTWDGDVPNPVSFGVSSQFTALVSPIINCGIGGQGYGGYHAQCIYPIGGVDSEISVINFHGFEIDGSDYLKLTYYD